MRFNPDDIFNAMHAAAVGMVFSEYDWTPEQDALCSPMEWVEVRAGGADLCADEYELGHPDEFNAPF